MIRGGEDLQDTWSSSTGIKISSSASKGSFKWMRFSFGLSDRNFVWIQVFLCVADLVQTIAAALVASRSFQSWRLSQGK